MKISVIVPALNEAEVIAGTLAQLQKVRRSGGEIILADGGSDDNTAVIARSLVDKVVVCDRGRARQMNAGAALASGDLLVFVHADTMLSEQALSELLAPHLWPDQIWGFFPVLLSGRHWMFRLIAFGMNWRSRLTSVATGDQAIFVSCELWQKSGGYSDIPLMEDVELSKRLRLIAKPRIMGNPLITSSRRWEDNGIFRTVLLMWRLRWKYFRGCDPQDLKKEYR